MIGPSHDREDDPDYFKPMTGSDWAWLSLMAILLGSFIGTIAAIIYKTAT